MSRIRQRDQAVVAVVGTVLVALVVLLSLNLNSLPFLHTARTTYTAEFENSGGLTSGTDVRVAGISVGSVSSVRVTGDHVTVRFTVKQGLALGSTSSASVEIATVLGELFMQVESAGPGRLAAGATIPLTRTTVPYTLLDTLNAVGSTTSKIDLPSLQNSLQQLATTLNGTSTADVTATLQGLTSTANALASRQDEISTLLDEAQQVTATLTAKGSAIVSLIGDGDTFLQMLIDRKTAINNLLTDTASLGTELGTLVTKNGAVLTPLLTNLTTISGVLVKDKTQLEQAISTLGQFSTNITNVTGSGPWLDVMLPELLQTDNVIAACGQHPAPGCGN